MQEPFFSCKSETSIVSFSRPEKKNLLNFDPSIKQRKPEWNKAECNNFPCERSGSFSKCLVMNDAAFIKSFVALGIKASCIQISSEL